MYFCARVSLIRPAPIESPRSGMKQGCLVVAVRYMGLPFFCNMKKYFYLLFSVLILFSSKLQAQQKSTPDTVKTGIYIISIHDIDFREKEYTIRFWLWMKYKNPQFNFAKNIEVTNAKSIEISNCNVDTTNGEVYTLMKLKCVMKESWEVRDYPFDNQQLQIHIENSQFDSHDLVFVADTAGKHFDPKLTVSGWDITNINVASDTKPYETGFGDPEIINSHSEYGSFDVIIDLDRNAWGLFFKLFLGMYVAFFITYVSIYIHADNIDSRFGLSVGALFAAVGNKYIIDSLLPESSTFTLVDSLHAFTFISIFVTISLSVYALKLLKEGHLEKANLIDKRGARILLSSYLILNAIFIATAILR